MSHFMVRELRLQSLNNEKKEPAWTERTELSLRRCPNKKQSADLTGE